MTLRSDELCTFDEIYKRGDRYIKKYFGEHDNFDDEIMIIKQAASNFGNFGIKLDDSQAKYIRSKIKEYIANNFFNDDGDIDFDVHDFYAPQPSKFEVFRDTFPERKKRSIK